MIPCVILLNDQKKKNSAMGLPTPNSGVTRCSGAFSEHNKNSYPIKINQVTCNLKVYHCTFPASPV